MKLDQQNLLQVSEDLITIRDLIRWAFSQFNTATLYFGHGTDNTWDEAVQLVLSGLHLPPNTRPDLMSARLTTTEKRHICDLIIRRLDDRIPVPYLTREAWFANLPFFVDERVIIPRSPIAELIEREFSPWLNDEPAPAILDLCTGSGCIAIASAITFPASKIDAIDNSSDALEVAKINCKKHGVLDQVTLIESDLFNALNNQRYDLIVSNPPYVSAEEYTNLAKEYHHEPPDALKAGENGLSIIHRILHDAGKYLKPDGVLIVEVGNAETALVKAYPQVPFLWLDFERGGEGVFLLTAAQCREYQSYFNKH